MQRCLNSTGFANRPKPNSRNATKQIFLAAAIAMIQRQLGPAHHKQWAELVPPGPPGPFVATSEQLLGAALRVKPRSGAARRGSGAAASRWYRRRPAACDVAGRPERRYRVFGRTQLLWPRFPVQVAPPTRRVVSRGSW